MNYFQYFIDELPDDTREDFVAGLNEITNWFSVPINTYMYSNIARNMVFLYRFKGLFVKENGELSIYFEHVGTKRVFNESLLLDKVKWYFWKEDLWLEKLKETEEKHGQTWLLARAIRYNDFLTVRKLIERGFPLERKDRDDRTVLIRAILTGRLEMAKLLIEHGADISVEDRNKQNVLHAACMMKREEATEIERAFICYLLTLPISLNAKDTNGRNPFQVLLLTSNLFTTSIGLLFLEKGTIIHEKDRYDCSPLLSAIRGNNLEAIELLVKHGANMDDFYKEEEHILSFVKSTEVYEFFAKRMDLLSPLGQEKLIENRLKLLFR